ncbi:MAG: CDP-alcohol phosphatidyltransferase family protein [Actinomycetota bacterium]|nr:CDP-alcohol phosphatidyltransferase family protein [Actinomycetota bacterium]
MRVRPKVTRFIEPIGKGLAAIGMTPAAMTVLGLVVVITGAVVIANDRLVLGAWIVLGGSLLDGLDGAVARASNSVSARGAFLDSAFDRLGEIAAFAGLGVAMAGEARLLLLIILAVGGAILVPFMRARAEADGLEGKGGIMGRAERIILFSAGLIFAQVEPMLWIFVVLVWLTAVQRFVHTYRSFE